MANKRLVVQENFSVLPEFYFKAKGIAVSYVQAVHLGTMPDPCVCSDVWHEDELKALDVTGVPRIAAVGWAVTIVHFRHHNKSRTVLNIGCKQYASAKEAHDHVDRCGRSRTSGKRRPLRKAFVDMASAVAKINGWRF